MIGVHYKDGVPWNRSGVYRIISPSGKCYAGGAKTLAGRRSSHWHALRKGIHKSLRLQNAWNKYGEGNMRFEVLLICAPEQVLMYEQRTLDILKPEYNMLKHAGVSAGLSHTPEAIAKMSAFQSGKVLSEDHKAQISKFQRGRSRPEGFGAKVSAGLKGKKKSAEHRAKMPSWPPGHLPWNTGKEWSDEVKAKISKATMGRAGPNKGKKLASMTIFLRQFSRYFKKERAEFMAWFTSPK